MTTEYTPHGSGTPDIVATHYVRQNPGKTNHYTLDMVRDAQAIHIPFAHDKQCVDAYRSGSFTPHEKAALALNLPTDTIIVVTGGSAGFIARITSPIKAGILEPLYVAMSDGAPVEYMSRTDTTRIASALSRNLTLTPFHTLYRTIDILGTITDVDDWRKIAQMGSSGRHTLHLWKKNR